MNKFLTKIAGVVASLAMVIGVGVGVASKQAKGVYADSFNTTYDYSGQGTTWTGDGFEDADSYWKSSADSNVPSVATVFGLFTGKTITSDVTITLDIACFGNGSSPTSSKFGIYTTRSCTSQIAATQSGTLPTDKNYKNTIYTVSSSNASGFSDDIAIRIAGGTKQIRLRSFTIAFSYTTGSVESHSLTYEAGTNGVYDGSTDRSFDVVEGGTHTVLAPASVGINASLGYVFSGWNDGLNNYNPNSSYTMGTSDVTLTAQWVAGVALSYDGNGAASGSVNTTYVVSGGTQTVAANGFTAPDGKEFKEWNTLANGQGTAYNPGAEIENFTSPLVLYAIWKNISHIDFDATIDTGDSPLTKQDITLTLSSGVMNNGNEYRFYKNSTLEISRSSGKIGSIEFTCTASGTSKYGPGNFTVDTGDYTYSGSVGNWEGAATSVTFTASTEQVRATNIVVHYFEGADVTLNKEILELVIGGSASTVAVSEISGITNPTYEWERISGDDCVTLTNTATDTVTVAPKGSSFASCTLALTVNGDNLQSPIVREVAVYVARNSDNENPYNVTEAKNAIDLNNSAYLNQAHVAGIVSSITAFNDGDNTITYWISDDGTTANQLEAYHGKGVDQAAFESIDDIDLGASVKIKGDLTLYGSTYEFATGNYMVSYTLTAETKVSKLNSKASLSYNYTKQGNGVLDQLTRGTTGITGTIYADWSNKTVSSDAVYAGQSAGGNSSIQLRSENSNSGVITTASGGLVTKITVSWHDQTASGRTINIYGKNTAYSSPSDLYGEDAGTLLGTIVKGTSTELEINDDYQYIGIRSNSGALYLSEIDIQWGDPVSYTYSDTAIRFGGLISKALWDELDTNEHLIQGYGVMISYEDLAGDTFEYYYNDSKAGKTVEQTVDFMFDNDGLGGDQDDGLIHGKDYYFPLTNEKTHPAEAIDSQKVGEPAGTYYVWNLYKKVSMLNLTKDYTAVAYIRVGNELIFLQQTTASAQSLAHDLISSGAYANDAFEGSLANLASL